MLKGMWRAELAVGGAVRPGIVGVVSLTVLTLVSVASAVVPYASVRIPDPGNRLQGITALNEGGRVACWNRTGTGYIWDGTNVTLLPGSGVLRESWSLAINDSDVAVGGISLGGFNLGGYSKAAKWQGGVLTQLDLGTLNGNDSVAYAINNAGMIAGRSIIGGNFHMFTLSPGGAVTDIGVPPAGLVPWIEGMNESGQVIMMGGGEMDGYIWQNGIYTPLHDTDGTNFGAPYGINDAGVVVGMSAPHQRNAKAVVWEGGVISRILPVQEGTAGSLAYDINNVGQIVGYYEDLQTIMRPCLWDVDGTFHDLTALVQSGPTERFERAVLINEAGQIAVAGSWDVGYLLAPIPEPATLSLLALGGLAALRRRRK